MIFYEYHVLINKLEMLDWVKQSIDILYNIYTASRLKYVRRVTLCYTNQIKSTAYAHYHQNKELTFTVMKYRIKN